MHAQPPWLAVNHMGLELADVMADVVDDLEAYVPGRPLQDCCKCPADPVGDELPIGKGKIRRAGHRAEVFLGLG